MIKFCSPTVHLTSLWVLVQCITIRGVNAIYCNILYTQFPLILPELVFDGTSHKCLRSLGGRKTGGDGLKGVG
jgi:hypothetical protein